MICQQKFTNFEDFKKHVKTHYERKNKQKVPKRRVKDCLVCAETFETNEAFIEHLENHSNEELRCNRFYNTRCFYISHSIDDFKNHYKLHFMRIKPEYLNIDGFEFFCNDCKIPLKELCGLSNHLRFKHPQELEFRCSNYFSIAGKNM